MTFRWATFTYEQLLRPAIRFHYRYYQTKVLLDRYLEQQSCFKNTLCGILAGGILYLTTSTLMFLVPSLSGSSSRQVAESIAPSLLPTATTASLFPTATTASLLPASTVPSPESASTSSTTSVFSTLQSWVGSNRDAWEIIRIMRLDGTAELPPAMLMKAKELLIARIEVVNDNVALQRQREENKKNGVKE